MVFMLKIIFKTFFFCSITVCLLAQPAAAPATNAPAATAVSTNAPAVRRGGNGPVPSPQIDSEGKVTFRLRAPNAKEVQLFGEWAGNPGTLTKNDEGIWSVTLGPLPPELYGYAFVVEGIRMPDPGNPKLKPMRSPTTS